MVSGFSKKNISTKTLGERLREIRKKAGVSIEEIANAIKVNKKYLRQIEADDYNNMPSEIYIRGFLRNYSNFLGIESNDVMKIYEKERGIENNIKKINKKVGKQRKIQLPTLILSSRVVFGVLFGVFMFIIGWYFYQEAGQFSETPRLLISKPIDNSVVEQSSVELVGITDVGNKVSVNGQVIFVNEKGEFRERIALKNGINELIVKSANKFGKEIEKTIKLSAQYDRDLPSKSFDKNDGSEMAEEKKVKLVIKVNNSPVWVSVKSDGVNVYSGTILVGAEQFFVGNDELIVTSGRANETFIKVNDEQDFHKLADVSGTVRDVVFRKQSEDSVKNEEGQIHNEKDINKTESLP